MLVFKFGGASVKSSDAVRNLVDILRKFEDNVVVVVSAMGKTTNALEGIIESFVRQEKKNIEDQYMQIRTFHLQIIEDLFVEMKDVVTADVDLVFQDLLNRLSAKPTLNYDYDYDQLIGYGEILSTKIVAAYLQEIGLQTRWVDVRESLKTDNTFREGRVNWELSTDLVKENFIFEAKQFLVTQGFLGSNINNQTVSLGREGSDFSASILAYILGADSVTIWKDVPGVLNADPKYFDDTILIKELSYLDAIELAYYGTSVIHPKTIKPLQNKNINLHVKSFIDPEAPGTLVANLTYEELIPSFIFKMDQVLIRISPHDFSFIEEVNQERIFGIFHKNGLKLNLQQTSAVSFQVVVNNDKRKLPKVLKDLEEHFNISFETGLELVTIRYFDDETIDRVMVNKTLLLEQRGVKNIQLLVRDLGE